MRPSGSSVRRERTFTVWRTERTSTEEAFSSGWGHLRQEAGFQNLIVASKRVKGPKKTPGSWSRGMASQHEKSRKRMPTSSTKRWAGHINVELWQLREQMTHKHGPSLFPLPPHANQGTGRNQRTRITTSKQLIGGSASPAFAEKDESFQPEMLKCS